jgi:hypothetical protein
LLFLSHTAYFHFADENVLPYCEKTLDLIRAAASRPTALGIGSGGSIIQHIERDDNNPRIWDVANSKILNVQIIDSTTFKLVTGFDPPKTPITVRMYQEMGLPFYKLWRDEEKEGVAGEWGALIGVDAAESKNMKRMHQGKGNLATGLVGTTKWGLPKPGSWGLFGNKERSAVEEGNIEGGPQGKESSFDFPVMLLDVDDTLPRFKGIVKPEESEDAWETMEGEGNE